MLYKIIRFELKEEKYIVLVYTSMIILLVFKYIIIHKTCYLLDFLQLFYVLEKCRPVFHLRSLFITY